MARTKVAKSPTPPAAPAPSRFATDPHHDAATRWCAFARGVLERLLFDAQQLRRAARSPGHPLHDRFDETDLAHAIDSLGEASMSIMNCDSTPPCLIDVPPPLLDE